MGAAACPRFSQHFVRVPRANLDRLVSSAMDSDCDAASQCSTASGASTGGRGRSVAVDLMVAALEVGATEKEVRQDLKTRGYKLPRISQLMKAALAKRAGNGGDTQGTQGSVSSMGTARGRSPLRRPRKWRKLTLTGDEFDVAQLFAGRGNFGEDDATALDALEKGEARGKRGERPSQKDGKGADGDFGAKQRAAKAGPLGPVAGGVPAAAAGDEAAGPRPPVKRRALAAEVTEAARAAVHAHALTLEAQFVEQDIRGDGNCFFRAVATQTAQGEASHRELRARMVAEVQARQPDFAEYMVGGNQRAALRRWCACMSRNEWADNLAVRVVCNVTARPIVVFRKEAGQAPTVFVPPGVAAEECCAAPGPIFVLLDERNAGCEHYTALIPIGQAEGAAGAGAAASGGCWPSGSGRRISGKQPGGSRLEATEIGQDGAAKQQGVGYRSVDFRSLLANWSGFCGNELSRLKALDDDAKQRGMLKGDGASSDEEGVAGDHGGAL